MGRTAFHLYLPPGFTKPLTQLGDIRSAPDDKVGTLIISEEKKGRESFLDAKAAHGIEAVSCRDVLAMPAVD